MITFPVTFPADEAKMLVGYLRGERTASSADLIQAGYAVIGFVLGQFLRTPAGASASETVAVETVSEEEAAAHLEHCCKMAATEHNTSAPLAAGALPWKPLALLVLSLIQQWLSSTAAAAKAP